MSSYFQASWYEIPVLNLVRATLFYESIFQTKLTSARLSDVDVALFPMVSDQAAGCLVHHPDLKPASSLQLGVLVYLNTSVALSEMIRRIERMNGRIVLLPQRLPSTLGEFMHVQDSEGNVIGLRKMH